MVAVLSCSHTLGFQAEIGVFLPQTITQSGLGSHKTKSPLQRTAMHISFHSISHCFPPSPVHYPPLSPPSTLFLLRRAAVYLVGAWRTEVPSHISARCHVSTQQMNGLHAISLKEENCKAEGGLKRGVVSCVGGWGTS